jgi:DNA helicase TIP49 (TBP-interacting protein)
MYKKGEKVNREQMEEFVNSINTSSRRPTNRSLRSGEKVFFEPGCTTSRKKFKEDYKENSIVHNIDEADVVIVGENYNQVHGAWRLFRKNTWGAGLPLDEKVLEYEGDIKKVNEILLKYKLHTSTIPMISQNVITVASTFTREMTPEEREKIGSYVGSTDPEMENLGYTLLMHYDPEINEESFVLILCRASNHHPPKTRLFKQIKRKLKLKYINLR